MFFSPFVVSPRYFYVNTSLYIVSLVSLTGTNANSIIKGEVLNNEK